MAAETAMASSGLADGVGTSVGVEAGRAGQVGPLDPARGIPTSFLSSVKSWWATGEKQSALSEERLLRKLPFYQSSAWSRTGTTIAATGSTSLVPLSPTSACLTTHDRYINTFTIAPTSPAPPTSPSNSPVVLLHGYGAGLGFFYRNYLALGQWVARSRRPIYALDWLGMGRSARVPFVIKAKREDTDARVTEAEAFFVDSLEEWREAMGLERMTLVGHSLGAYLSTVYALKYPTRVDKLVLLSPAGVPHGPSTSEPARELTDDREEITHHDGNVGNGNGNGRSVVAASSERVNWIREEQKEAKQDVSKRQRLMVYLWEEGWSPFQIVRTLNVFAPMLVGKYSSRRFSGLSEEETRDIHDYILNITLAKGSGEYCISHILAPYAYARKPLVDRIDELKIPITFVYGDQDWMDPEGGYKSVEQLRKAGNRSAKMVIVKNAGHHVYLDNAIAINDLLIRELDRV